MGAEVIQVTIGDRSRLAMAQASSCRCAGTNVTLVVREGKGFVPHGRTVLKHHDQLLVVSTQTVRDKAEQRIKAVDSGGRLAGWA